MITNRTVIEFDPASARYRTTTRVLGLPVTSAIHDMWLTPYIDSGAPADWRFAGDRAFSRSGGHGGWEYTLVELRTLDSLVSVARMSDETRQMLADRIGQTLIQHDDGWDVYHQLAEVSRRIAELLDAQDDHIEPEDLDKIFETAP